MALVYLDQYLHRRYAKPGKIENLASHDRVVLDMLNKGSHSGSGKSFHEPVILSNPQGLASNFTDMLDISDGGHEGSATVVGEWTALYGDYVGAVNITDKDVAAGGDVPDGAYLKPFGLQSDSLIDSFGERMSTYIFSEPGKSIGTYNGNTVSSGVLTLLGTAAEGQILNFNKGQGLQVSSEDGSSTAHVLLGSGAKAYVIAVDYDGLTVTLSGTKGGAAGVGLNAAFTTADTSLFLFNAGDFQGTASPTFIIDSFADWIPSTAPTGVFKGLDRTGDSRMGGVRLTAAQATGLSTEERIKKLVTKINGPFGGGKGEKVVVMESVQWQKLASVLETRGQRPLDGKTANCGYQYLQINTGRGVCKVISDPMCRPDVFWAFEMDKWTLRTLDGFPKIVNGDGFQMLRKSDSNTYQFRIAAYAQLTTPYPSRHGRGPVDTAA